MRLVLLLFTLFFGKKVGSDDFGNQYYICHNKWYKNKRWVVFNGIIDGAKIPDYWLMWLRHTVDQIPDTKDINKHQHQWQQIRKPNLTGTKHHFNPGISNAHIANSNNSYNRWEEK